MGSAEGKYKIIYVEDNPTDFDMVRAILEDEDVLEWMICAEKKKDLIEAISRYDFDLILTEYSLTGIHGFEAINIVLKHFSDKPIIMLTGSLPDEIAIDAIKKGAWDYVLKQNIYRLVPSIRGVMDKKRILDENVAAQKALKESEENYRLLAESSPYGIIVHSEGKIRYYNKTVLKIFGLPDDLDVIGREMIELIHPEHKDIEKSPIVKLFRGESLHDFLEEVFLHPDGREIFVEVSSAVIMYNGLPAVQVIFRDISDRKRMELQLIEAREKAIEADRLKTSFLENLSHEIRTPLNGIIGFTNLLKKRLVDEETQKKYLQVIEDSSRHLLNIISDLIDISKIEAGQVEIHKERINLNDLLDELFMFFNDSSRLKNMPVELGLKKSQPDTEAYIMTDPIRLRQILINLLGNSFKFTHKGRIDFGYEKEDDKSVRFFVKDTGVGIPKNAHDIIFKRFRQVDESKTRKHGGNGLGLSICKGLVEAMNGKIWFDSREGQGTIFYFRLPEQFLSEPISNEGNTLPESEQV